MQERKPLLVSSPHDLKNLDNAGLNRLAGELREKII
jgi:deoxyxylulose-5-phosphate synthase